MEHLITELFQRWEQAFDELPTLALVKEQIKNVRYAETFRFDPKKFEKRSFLPSGAFVDDKSQLHTDSPFEYGFNEDGLPCHVRFSHKFNGIAWEGFYTYSDTLFEYVEFCLNTGVPSVVTTIKFAGNRKLSLQSIMINGRGSSFSQSRVSKEQIIKEIKADNFSQVVTVTTYEYNKAENIHRASSIHKMPGAGTYDTHDEYSYDDAGILDSIRTFFDKGTNRLTYCQPEKGMTPKALVEHLSAAMAGSIADALYEQQLEEPITLLELNYRYAENYSPMLVWETAPGIEAKIAAQETVFTLDYFHGLQIDTLPFERLFAQKEQMILMDDDNADLGRNMLIATASLLTKNKLFGKTKVSDDFAAYAIDWSIEGHSDKDFEEILTTCGMTAEGIHSWKKKGIIAGS